MYILFQMAVYFSIQFGSVILEKELIKRNNDASGRRCKLYIFAAELAEHSPIIIQNSSNPSSLKNLGVRPYDHTRCYF